MHTIIRNGLIRKRLDNLLSRIDLAFFINGHLCTLQVDLILFVNIAVLVAVVVVATD